MHTQKTLRNTLIVLAVMFSLAAGGVLIVGGVVVAGVAFVVYGFSGGGVTPTALTKVPSNSLAVCELRYDDCTRTVEGTLVGQRDSDVNQAVRVMITTKAADGRNTQWVQTTARELNKGQTERVTFQLTDEQAAAFAHPDAVRRVSIVTDNSRLVLAETEWPK